MCALQVCVFESVDDSAVKLVAATTHLYFHPRAPHVRLLQTTVCLRHLQRVKTIYKQQVHFDLAIFRAVHNYQQLLIRAAIFKTWAISFIPLRLCLLEETLKAVSPFYLVFPSTWCSLLPGVCAKGSKTRRG